MEIRLENKIALVTGVAGGIGQELASRLVSAGAIVHGFDFKQDALDNLHEKVPGLHLYNVDLSDWEKTRETVEGIGRIDLLVNNAATAVYSDFIETTKDDLFRTLSVNTYAHYNISQAVAVRMIEHNEGGAIVNISSINGLRPNARLSAYCMSKASLDMLTKCLALELGKYKIRANSVNPSVVNTPMLMAGEVSSIERVKAKMPFATKVAETSDVADAVLFLLSDKAAMITGSILSVDGGYNIG